VQEEQVLVIERKVIEQVGVFHGLNPNVTQYLDKIFAQGAPRFMPRSLAEKDPGFKQIIPYVIITHNGKYLSYVRGKKAGETRLVAKRSIGIGGHINPVDRTLFSVDAYKIYLEAVQREVAEEINIEANYTDKIVALLNDDTNEVGQVHLGIVHHWLLDSPNVSKREQMITQMSFMTPEELQKVSDSMETWSVLCLNGLTSITKQNLGLIA
jgi:predicted NUDIX family phosphoesterase